MFKTDTQLQRDVIDELRWDPRVGPVEIGVAAREGVVTLSGTVDNYARKYAAEKAAERVAGVRAVAEELTVTLPSATVRSDTDLAHAIVSALMWDIMVPDRNIKSRVENGWVTLEGSVDWQFEVDAAKRAVRNLTGVRGVTNLLKVAKRVSESDVKERIESALKRHAEVDSKQIVVDAFDGKVTLRGMVHSWPERRQAELAAWSAPGVTDVDDKLLIGV